MEQEFNPSAILKEMTTPIEGALQIT